MAALLVLAALVALAVWAGMALGGRRVTPEATTEIETAVADTPQPAATDVRPTATAKPSPSATFEPSPTNTPKPTPTATATLLPTVTPKPQAGDMRVVVRGGIEVEQVYVPPLPPAWTSTWGSV